MLTFFRQDAVGQPYALFTAMSNSITLENVGAVSHAVVPLSEDGGVTIFQGRNGCGKSTALDAVSTLASGRGKLPPIRDGQKTGIVSGFGSRIDLRLAGSRRGGGKPELVVESIEGKFSISDLVNPNIQDPKAADKARLKALITLLGVDATPDLFVPLFETKKEFDENVSKSSTETTDPILMAERVKRDIEEKARVEEERARRVFAEHDALTVGAEFDPSDIIDDMAGYYAEMDTANTHLNKLAVAHESYRKVMGSVEEAKRAIVVCDIAQKERTIQSEEDAVHERAEMNADAETQIKALHERISEFESRINELENDIQRRRSENAASNRLINATKAELDSLAGYKKIVAQSETVKPVDADAMNAARQAVDALRSKLDRSAVAKENKRKQDSAKATLQRAESIRDKAAHLREAARRCDVILTELIGADSPLRIVDGRMVVDTERGETFYSELSDGERWKAAFEVVAQHVHRDPDKIAVLTIPQVGWESLDPTNQNLVVELSKRYRINTITAEATDGELTVETIG